MTTAHHLKALVKAHAERNDELFASVVQTIAATHEAAGHQSLAADLRKLIHKMPRQSNFMSVAQAGLSDILVSRESTTRLPDMFIDAELETALLRILREHHHAARLREFGLSPCRKLLLVGPPGTGKTMTAHTIAGEMDLPLHEVRLDALVSSMLGETASKLRKVFDTIAAVHGVYLFDEFDALGGQRDAPNEVGEMRRVLNCLLQMIEADQSYSLIIAATNHPALLDHALFRRFDAMLEYSLPNAECRSQQIRNDLGSFAPHELQMSSIAERTDGLSQAEIHHAVHDAKKSAVMQGDSQIQQSELVHFALRLTKKHSTRQARLPSNCEAVGE